jgi:probable HAF family extracellular repeat protein
MISKQLGWSLFLGMAILLASSAADAATTYNVVNIGLLPGYVSSIATSVDNAGEVVGYDTDASGQTQAFLWTQSGGLVGLGGTNSKAFAVNGGNVVGATGANGQAFRWTSSVGYVLLDPNMRGQANSVNSSGEIIGNRAVGSANNVSTWSASNARSNHYPGVNLTGNAINDLGHFVGRNVVGGAGYYSDGTSAARINLGVLATSINNNDIVAGVITNVNGSGNTVAAFENVNTLTMTTIGTLGLDLTSYALGINNSGTIVGVSGNGGFLDSGGSSTVIGMTDQSAIIYDTTSGLQNVDALLSPSSSQDWTIWSANAINDSGQIVGWGRLDHGVQEAVLLVPVPEPATWVLLAFGLVSLGAIALRRGRNNRQVVLAAALVAVQAPSAADAAPTYNVVNIGLLPGYVSSIATSVDNAGEVVGYDTDASGQTQAFLWTQAGGLVGLGGTNSKAFGANGGNVVGVTGFNQQAFRWTQSTGQGLWISPTIAD